jgi:hypothetical protein
MFNSRSGINISCAHWKYHDKERSRLKKAYEILPESVAMPLEKCAEIFNVGKDFKIL